jgi:arylformamidase
MKKRGLIAAVMWLAVLAGGTDMAHAKGPLREWLQKHREQRSDNDQDTESPSENNNYSGLSCKKLVKLVGRLGERPLQKKGSRPAPAGTYSYGKAPAQSLDVYVPEGGAKHAPIIFMVHGGAWCIGDKAAGHVTINKVGRWVAKGFIFVSVNYRMVPDGVDPLTQAGDVADALAYVQEQAAKWGGNPDKIIIMGHSAGAHLVSLLSADTALAAKHGVQPWLGAVSLDSGAVDVPSIMGARHAPFYDEAFGSDPAYWDAASPTQRLSAESTPWLGVCSAQRKDSCPNNHIYADKARGFGLRAEVIEEDMAHDEINKKLGENGDYTSAVEAFMGSLDRDVKARLE